MDNSFKSRVSGFKAGLQSSHMNNSNYLLRSATKNNVSRRQGIYSKFLSKPTTAKNLDFIKRNLSSGASTLKQADISKLQTSQLNGRKGNETCVSLRDTIRNETSGFHNVPPAAENISNNSRMNGKKDHLNSSSARKKSPIANGTDSLLRDARAQKSPPLERQSSRPESDINDHVRKRTDMSFSLSGRNLLSPCVVLRDCRKESAVERDGDGFAIPTIPVSRPKTKTHRLEDFLSIKKQAILSISDFLDELPQVESFYLLKRTEDVLLNLMRKTMSIQINGNSGFQQDKDTQISDWLSKNGDELNHDFMASSVPFDKAPSVVPESVIRSATTPWVASNPPILSVYLLKNWTLIKGSGPEEVMLNGDLYDITSQGIVEENHATSKVIKAEGTHVQTSCCMYNLTPSFHDRNNSIPPGVKQYFVGGRFPKNWVEIIKMWHLLKVTIHDQDQTSGYGRSHYDESSRLEDDRMSIRAPAEREGVLPEREERRIAVEREKRRVLALAERERRRVLAERERSRVLAERERSRWLAQEEERERAYQEEEEERPERDTHRREAEGRDSTKAAASISNTANSVSRYGRKRKSNGRFENDPGNKRLCIDLKRRMKTPVASGRASYISNRTRSALRGRRAESFMITPKSSKVNKLKNRKMTPGPLKGRIVIPDDSVSFNDSDIQ